MMSLKINQEILLIDSELDIRLNWNCSPIH